MDEDRIAESVVVDLSQKGRACFSVDGEPFPWWISEEGPKARRVAPDLYLVDVEIFCTLTPGDDRQETFFHGDPDDPYWNWYQPVLLGQKFPWTISYDGFTYRVACHDVATVSLAFFAKSVHGIEVTDDLPKDGKVRDSRGQLIRRVGPNQTEQTIPDPTVRSVDELTEHRARQADHLKNRRIA